MIMFQENYTKEKTNKWSVAGIHTNQNIEQPLSITLERNKKDLPCWENTKRQKWPSN